MCGVGGIENLSRCAYLCGKTVRAAECWFGGYRLTGQADQVATSLNFNCPCSRLALNNPDNTCDSDSLLPGRSDPRCFTCGQFGSGSILPGRVDPGTYCWVGWAQVLTAG